MPVGVDFDGQGTELGAHVDSLKTSSVSITMPGFGEYRWRARAVDSRGAKSDWVEFVRAADSEIDFWYRDNAAPNVNINANQYRASTGAIVAAGERFMDKHGITFRAAAVDSHNDAIRIEVRLAPAGGDPALATPMRGRLRVGESASLTANPPPGGYLWEWRVADEWDAASPWVEFGDFSDREADFTLLAYGSEGGRSCFGSSAVSGPGRMWTAWVLLPLFLMRTSRKSG